MMVKEMMTAHTGTDNTFILTFHSIGKNLEAFTCVKFINAIDHRQNNWQDDTRTRT